MEAPYLSKLVDTFANQGVIVLAANAWDEPRDMVTKFATEQKLKQRILLNAAETARAYGVSSLPTVIWINRLGEVTDVAMGMTSEREFEDRTRLALAKP